MLQEKHCPAVPHPSPLSAMASPFFVLGFAASLWPCACSAAAADDASWPSELAVKHPAKESSAVTRRWQRGRFSTSFIARTAHPPLSYLLEGANDRFAGPVPADPTRFDFEQIHVTEVL